MIVPGVSQGEVLDFLRTATAQVAPAGYSADYSGQSRQFVQESGGFVLTLLFATIIVFLALAAQFESFRDPFIVLAGSDQYCLGFGSVPAVFNNTVQLTWKQQTAPGQCPAIVGSTTSRVVPG